MKKSPTPILAILALAAILAPLPLIAQGQNQNQNPQKTLPPEVIKQLEQQLNNQRAPEEVKVPDPVPFKTKDGKVKGWKVAIPGGRPLATPAVSDGKVFIGGGFGSHEFYAFDAATGKKLWLYHTADDGPTAAVVSDGCVAFNTESCELEILTLDGKPLWKKWLGDPLMSMPAIAVGKVYMAYPDSKDKERQHYVAGFELKTGKEVWKQKIAGEIITAPVIQDGQLLLTCLEGSVFCFKEANGELVWQEKKNVTSAPLVWNGRCFFSQRDEEMVTKDGKQVKQQNEQVASRGVEPNALLKTIAPTRQTADYLDYAKRAGNSLREKEQAAQDATVGFAGGKGDAKIEQAQMNLGVGNVAGVWSFQGSKPFMFNNQLFSAMGDNVKCVDPKTEKVLWTRKLHETKEELLDSALTPPALVNDKVFVGTSKGEVFCLSAKTGQVVWVIEVGEPVLFQPAVAAGRVYISTSKGSLIALDTGDARDDGWLMWGANAAHNGKVTATVREIYGK